MSAFDYDSLDALGMAEAVGKRAVSPRELVDECIRRIERVNPKLNAVVTPMFERARAAATGPIPEGPLGGVPFLIKDLLQQIEGVRTSEGSRFFRDQVATHDSELISRYRRAGLVFVAKTNAPEYGLLPVTESALHGDAHNPWDLTRTPGGSSGGAAAVVASGIAPAAHGGDGGGSIRTPASCCGVFGLKPTRGRVPTGPDRSEQWSGFVQEHAITRTVRDSAALLDAVRGPELTSPYHVLPPERPFLDEVKAEPGRLRVAFHSEPPLPATVHPSCVAAVEDAARLLAELGHDVEEVSPAHDPWALARAYLTVVGGHTAAELRDAPARLGRKAGPGDFEPQTRLVAMLGAQFSAGDFVQSLEILQGEARRLARHYQAWDVLLTPTLAQPPVPVGALRPRGVEAALLAQVAGKGLSWLLRVPGVVERSMERMFQFFPFPPVANFTGQPAASVPLYWDADGLPIGVMLTGRFGDEGTLFRLSAQLEEARPWASRRPPVHARTA